MDLVSIIMPNYNGEKYLKETLDSVLNQTYENWELLFVDDCSTDRSVEIVKSYKDSRIKIFSNETNSGAATSRNYALREAKGKWIAFLDSDDLWTNDKLEKQVGFMEKNAYSFSYTKYEEVDGNSNKLNKVVFGPLKINKRKMFRYCWVGCLTVMYDREKVGLIQIENNIEKRNDYAIWLKVCKTAVCYLLPEILAKYRRREGSMSNQSKLSLIKYHYRLFRISENKSVIGAAFCTLRNLFYGVIKKVWYVKKY